MSSLIATFAQGTENFAELCKGEKQTLICRFPVVNYSIFDTVTHNRNALQTSPLTMSTCELNVISVTEVCSVTRRVVVRILLPELLVITTFAQDLTQRYLPRPVLRRRILQLFFVVFGVDFEFEFFGLVSVRLVFIFKKNIVLCKLNY